MLRFISPRVRGIINNKNNQLPRHNVVAIDPLLVVNFNLLWERVMAQWHLPVMNLVEPNIFITKYKSNITYIIFLKNPNTIFKILVDHKMISRLINSSLSCLITLSYARGNGKHTRQRIVWSSHPHALPCKAVCMLKPCCLVSIFLKDNNTIFFKKNKK